MGKDGKNSSVYHGKEDWLTIDVEGERGRTARHPRETSIVSIFRKDISLSTKQPSPISPRPRIITLEIDSLVPPPPPKPRKRPYHRRSPSFPNVPFSDDHPLPLIPPPPPPKPKRSSHRRSSSLPNVRPTIIAVPTSPGYDRTLTRNHSVNSRRGVSTPPVSRSNSVKFAPTLRKTYSRRDLNASFSSDDLDAHPRNTGLGRANTR